MIRNRVEELRKYMRNNGLNAFIVVSSDPHGSEYVADRWKSREWISGFDGSAGTAVITMHKALLWTDSRYWLAAEKVLGANGYELMKDRMPDTPSIAEWLCANLGSGDTVGVDGTVCSIAEVEEWKSAFDRCGISLDVSHDPFAVLWNGRPAIPESVAEILTETGESAVSKLQRIREKISQCGCNGIFISMLDEIAWITNLRATDVDYNPVMVSYMLITKQRATLFVNSCKLTPQVSEYLASSGIDVAEYDDVWPALEQYAYKNIILHKGCNAAVSACLNAACRPVYQSSPVAAMKAVKNSVEIEGFKKAMLSEGVAMVKLLHWLKPAIKEGGITELDVDKKLTALRSCDKAFRGLSFATIAAYGENGAIVHYEPNEKENALLQPKGFLLLDCGGQYNCGTTDITRTIPLGPLSQEEKEDYTRVLRGHISLAMAKFPIGTCGTQLDVLARQWLWQAGENYLHGTGHGVGYFLNVHEGPHQIRMNHMPAPLLPGMTVTNEPGLYKAGRFGVRIENTMLVTEYLSTEFGDYCALTPLTVCPIDKDAIIPELLGCDAIDYLNSYHEWVFEQLSPYFEDEMFDYLKSLCAPL